MEILEKFRHDDVASGVVTFRSVHPRWCYIVPEGDGRVAQAAEKRVVSDIAVAGFYYFRRAGDFFAAARRAILNGDDVEGQYYFSAALNQIILSDEEVAYVKIEASRYYSFYSPEKIAEFAATELAASLRDQSRDDRPINVLIPAAGEGSRFARQNWRKPKPFIDVDGRMMLEHVIGNVCPPNATPTVLLRAEHMKACDGDVQLLRAMGTTIKPVDHLTEGTACGAACPQQLRQRPAAADCQLGSVGRFRLQRLHRGLPAAQARRLDPGLSRCADGSEMVLRQG